MKTNYISCPFCTRDFNHTDRIPYIITDCGHSICELCLSNKLTSSQFFECPEDQKVISIYNMRITDFPKNHALLSIINRDESKDTSGNLKNNSTQYTKTISGKIKSQENLLYAMKQDVIKEENIYNHLLTDKKKVGNREKSLSSDEQVFDQVCEVHGKKLELVCLNPGCSQKICYECGLFGEHVVR